jgi:predicted transcriptional regulator
MMVLRGFAMSGKHAYVMMIHDKWWQGFCRRQNEGKQTHSYVQRGAGAPKETKLILFYVAKPESAIKGYAEFIERKTGNPEEIWKTHGKESVLKSKEKFIAFIGVAPKASFIRFRNLRVAAEPMPLKDVLSHLGLKRLSRKGFYMDKETADKLIEYIK